MGTGGWNIKPTVGLFICKEYTQQGPACQPENAQARSSFEECDDIERFPCLVERDRRHPQGPIPLKLKELEEKCWKSGERDVGAQFIAPAWKGDAAHRA